MDVPPTAPPPGGPAPAPRRAAWSWLRSVDANGEPGPWPVALLTLLGLTVAAFAASVFAGAHLISPSPDVMLRFGANYAPLTLGGEPWRLLTSVFLHFGLIHLAVNLMVALQLGPMVELAFGRAGMVAIYLAAGVLGSVASLLRTGPPAVAAGASGAVFGLIGALAVMVWVRRKHMPPEVTRGMARQLGVTLAINLVISFSVPQIDLLAHLGGLLAGTVAAAALTLGTSARQQRGRRALAVVLATLALAAGATQVIKPAAPVEAAFQAFAAEEAGIIARFQELAAAFDQGTADAPTTVAAMEADIVPAWAAARDRFDAATRSASLSPTGVRLRDVMVRFGTARADFFTNVIAWLRAGGDPSTSATHGVDASVEKLTQLQQELEFIAR